MYILCEPVLALSVGTLGVCVSPKKHVVKSSDPKAVCFLTDTNPTCLFGSMVYMPNELMACSISELFGCVWKPVADFPYDPAADGIDTRDGSIHANAQVRSGRLCRHHC